MARLELLGLFSPTYLDFAFKMGTSPKRGVPRAGEEALGPLEDGDRGERPAAPDAPPEPCADAEEGPG